MKNIIFILALAFGMSSCSKEGSNGEQFTYEVTGNVTGSVSIQYTPDITDAIPPEDMDYEVTTTLPWKKTVTLHQNVAGASCSASIDDETPGRQITIKIFRGDTLVAEHTKKVDGDGHLSMLMNYYKDMETVKL